MSFSQRCNVRTAGDGVRPIMFVHGFGCDQTMWRHVVGAFDDRYRTVLLDLVGSGGSDLSAYSRAKYATLEGYASDIVAICEELNLKDVILVGHSVSAMIGVLAANARPDLIARLVLVAPSPCYVNDGAYVGGFERADVDGLLEFLDANHLGWSNRLAPAIMGVPERPELAEELTASFCRTDPEISRHFARVTFLSDHRADVRKCFTPSLILQCSEDLIAPVAVGRWMRAAMPASALVEMQAKGHCPHLSAPEETVAAIRGFLDRDA